MKPSPDPKNPESSKEVLYVPVEYLQSVQDSEDRIDLFELLKTIWQGRATLILSVILFLIAGILFAIYSTEEFTSEVKLIPETQQTSSLGSLGALARQFGVSAGEQSSREAISPVLYPEITNSTIFLLRLLNHEVTLTGGEQIVTIQEYVREHQKIPLGTSIRRNTLRYTIMLPLTIRNWFRSSGDDSEYVEVYESNPVDGRILRLTGEEWGAVGNLRGRIETSMNRDTRVVSVRVKMQDPEVSAEIADKVVQLLSEYIIEYRTEKARNDMEFIRERFEEAKARFEYAQEELALFRDRNRGQLTALASTQEELLQSQYNLHFNIYNSMAERLEEARIKLQEETPVLSIVQPAAVPPRPSEPNRMLIVIAFLFIGAVAGITIILGRQLWITIQAKVIS